jgi:predicted transcriptional regulator
MMRADRLSRNPVDRETASIELEPELQERLRRLAEAQQRTPHGLMREAIVQYVAREEAREQMRGEALAAWEEYKATGAHVPGAVVDVWLARLEAGEDADPPACRS